MCLFHCLLFFILICGDCIGVFDVVVEINSIQFNSIQVYMFISDTPRSTDILPSHAVVLTVHVQRGFVRSQLRGRVNT